MSLELVSLLAIPMLPLAVIHTDLFISLFKWDKVLDTECLNNGSRKKYKLYGKLIINGHFSIQSIRLCLDTTQLLTNTNTPLDPNKMLWCISIAVVKAYYVFITKIYLNKWTGLYVHVCLTFFLFISNFFIYKKPYEYIC